MPIEKIDAVHRVVGLLLGLLSLEQLGDFKGCIFIFDV